GLFDEILDVGTAARQAALADAFGKLLLAHQLMQCLHEAVLSGNNCALRPDCWKRQPATIVALEARPQSRAQKRRLAGARRSYDDEHALDPCAHQAAHLVEAAHDLGIPPKENGGVFLLEGCKSGIGPPSRLKGETRRIEPGALQSLPETSICK